MAERSFKSEVKHLRLGKGDTFTGEGILAITKALLENALFLLYLRLYKAGHFPKASYWYVSCHWDLSLRYR